MVSDENILTGERVRLTAPRLDDLEAIGREQEDAGFWRMLSTSPRFPRTRELNSKWLQELTENSDAFVFAIRPVDDDRYVGLISLEDVLWSHGVAELGMGISREFWGKGYGAEALDLVLRFAFDELNLHRVSLGVFAYNDRAVALYERAGFVKEGVDREFLHRDGERHDLIRYGMLRREWEARPGR